MWIRWSGGPAALPISLLTLLLWCGEKPESDVWRRRSTQEHSVWGFSQFKLLLVLFFFFFFFSPLLLGAFTRSAAHFHFSWLRSESTGSTPQLLWHTPYTGCDVDVSALRWGEADSRLCELERGEKNLLNQWQHLFFLFLLLLHIKAKPAYFKAITATIYSCHSLSGLPNCSVCSCL